ncbi:hypothetical protein CPS_2450 [Colwellia psychrerythraea 34H]|uniref:Uncharacterized protein n=1 Tax=Colwellia psychrerythraea (strain 34H / ATCC BAA-681) TaxID=167879 RepID=Q481V2_COLP3|nr:hypothetical protein CPS_2450 [Colwellia psychrerythraea 34H]
MISDPRYIEGTGAETLKTKFIVKLVNKFINVN